MMSLKVSRRLVVLGLLLCSIAVASAFSEYKQCKHQCERQRRSEREQCERRCEDYYREKRSPGGGGGGGGRWAEYEVEDEVMAEEDDPETKLRRCEDSCERQREGEQKSLCRMRCRDRYRREQSPVEDRGDWERERERESRREWEERGGRRGDSNPYVFEPQDFSPWIKSQHGKIEVLEKFTSKSKLLWRLKNMRLGFMEVDPQSFVSPTHLDADIFIFVAKGRGTVTMILEDKKHTVNLEKGDIAYLPAGYPVFMVNHDSNEKLVVFKLMNSVNLPGNIEDFHGPGSEERESFYQAFSDEILEAAFKTDSEKLKRVFGQNRGVIVKATKEQIQALSRHEESPRIWPFSKESAQPFNLFRNSPVISNNYGKLFEATSKDCSYLQDFTISVANITQGSMSGPFYNSKSTKIAVVLDGEGQVEIACPHISSFGRRERGARSFEKVSSELRRGTVFVVPAGHPVVTVAAPNSRLQVLCFEVNAENNVRYPLAGRNNMFYQLEKEAKELAFGVPAREVEEVFGNQKEEFFFPGPGKSHRGRGYSDV